MRKPPIAWLVACAVLAVALVVTGCSVSGVAVPATPPVAASSEATVSVLGPYGRGVTAVASSIQFELLNVVVGKPQWMRLSERMWYGPGGTDTTATPGHTYVDVTVRVRDLNATASPDLQPPRTGTPYVIVDGRRYERVDGGEGGPVSELPSFRMTMEYELPTGAAGAILYVPTSESATQVVSFRLQ